VIALVWLLVPTPATAGTNASVTFVNAITYDAAVDFPLTLCLDGVVQQADVSTGDQVGPIALPPDEYLVEFTQGSDCAAPTFAEGAVTIGAGDDVTVMGWWGPEGPDVALLPNESGCLEPGEGRVVLRHAAATDDVDLSATPAGGSPTEVMSAVAPGSQAGADLPGGLYESGVVTDTASGDVVLDLGMTFLSEGELVVLYLFGGADGDIGVFPGSAAALDPCATPSSSTTTTVPAAQPATQPRFTG
jgi:hypothetical protein